MFFMGLTVLIILIVFVKTIQTVVNGKLCIPEGKLGMDKPKKDWWNFRKEDLIALAENEAPLFVYNEEALNEIFFDLSAMDALSGLFYPYHLNFHQQILRKAFELGAHFRCNSFSEVVRLKEHFQNLAPERIFFLSDHEDRRDCEAALHHGSRGEWHS